MLKIRGSLLVLQAQAALVPPIVDQVFAEEGLMVCVLTSGYRLWDQSSLHPFGYAQDFDAEVQLNMETWDKIRTGVADRLGPEYDVIVHDVGSGLHLHVEYDPRKPK